MATFIAPNFDTGDVEFRCDGKEVCIYATPDGLKKISELCEALRERLTEESSHHLHIEDYELLTSSSLRAVIAGFRKR